MVDAARLTYCSTAQQAPPQACITEITCHTAASTGAANAMRLHVPTVHAARDLAAVPWHAIQTTVSLATCRPGPHRAHLKVGVLQRLRGGGPVGRIPMAQRCHELCRCWAAPRHQNTEILYEPNRIIGVDVSSNLHRSSGWPGCLSCLHLAYADGLFGTASWTQSVEEVHTLPAPTRIIIHDNKRLFLPAPAVAPLERRTPAPTPVQGLQAMSWPLGCPSHGRSSPARLAAA